MPLRTLTIRDAESVIDAESKMQVFHVFDPHALVQAAGYLKFKNGSARSEGVYFRGETKLHGSLSPSLFRGIRNQAAQSNRQNQLTSAITDICSRNKLFSSFPPLAHEALLQHYGLRTSWIDLVDNVWIALWFACHKAHATGPASEYLHFEKRSVHKEPGGFSYILLIAADTGRDAQREPGVSVGNTTELIDLRCAAPSIFLRPHSQHGLLMRMRGDHVRRPFDYQSQVRGVLRISLADALNWLGDGQMLGVHALFPPPYYDCGYKILLDAELKGSKTIRSIAHVGS